MSKRSRVIRDRATLLADFDNLGATDIISGTIALKRGEEHLLLDLVERGVGLIPSATSQLASKSKVFQTALLRRWMVPGTTVIYDRHQLLEAINQYHREKRGKVVLKQDNKNAGFGILLYNSIEDLYTQAANGTVQYPFVLQPFLEDSQDIRAIFLGEYVEAYTRINPDNFRNNLHCGGQAAAHPLSETEMVLCREVMTRASFPYAHLDIMYSPVDKSCYLAEINLRGGLRGATITTAEYKRRKAALEQAQVEALMKG